MRNSTWSDPGYCDDEYFFGPSVALTLTPPPPTPQPSRIDDLLGKAFAAIPGTTWDEKLAACNACNCCARHQTFRPAAVKKWEELQWHGTQGTDCVCNCRHMARFICRQADETEEVAIVITG